MNRQEYNFREREKGERRESVLHGNIEGNQGKRIMRDEEDETTDKNREEKNKDEKEITKEELVEQLRKLKEEKRSGINGIENEI